MLVYRLLLPLGRPRALIGAIAFAFTPMVFLASVSAMDHIWGAVFILAATLCVLHNRVLWCSIFLGLAVASRPTYALAVIPMVLLYVDFDVHRLGQLSTWRKLIPVGALARPIAAVFFAPEVMTLGTPIFDVSSAGKHHWIRAAYLGSFELFGVLGSITVLAAFTSAALRRRAVHVTEFRALDRWSFTVIVIWGARIFIPS